MFLVINVTSISLKENSNKEKLQNTKLRGKSLNIIVSILLDPWCNHSHSKGTCIDFQDQKYHWLITLGLLETDNVNANVARIFLISNSKSRAYTYNRAYICHTPSLEPLAHDYWSHTPPLKP